MGKIRLALVADADPRSPATNSGVALGLLTALEARSDVEVVAAVSSAPPPMLRAFVLVASWRPSAHRWRLAARRGRVARAVRSAVRSARLHGARIPDDTVVIHVRNVYRPTRWRYVSFVDTTIAESAAGWSEWDRGSAGLLEFERLYYEAASAICVAADAARASMLTAYGQPEQKVTRVGGGTNFVPDPALVDSRRRAARGTVTVLFVGKEFQRKGGDLLVDAVRLLRAEGVDVQLVVVGPRLEIEEDGVRTLGPVFERSELWRLYSQADVFCLPARWEPYGLVVQEAMAAGLPVVVSDTGELPAIVDDAGVVVSEPTAERLATALRPLLLDERLRAALGAQGVNRVSQHLGWNRVADRMVGAITAAIGPPRHP